MPIKRLLEESKLTPEDQKALNLAFVRALHMLHLVDRNDPICEMVARRIMRFRGADTSDPIAISEIVVRELTAK